MNLYDAYERVGDHFRAKMLLRRILAAFPADPEVLRRVRTLE